MEKTFLKLWQIMYLDITIQWCKFKRIWTTVYGQILGLPRPTPLRQAWLYWNYEEGHREGIEAHNSEGSVLCIFISFQQGHCITMVIYYRNKDLAYIDLIWYLVFNATFSNISAISWRPALVLEEARGTRREPPTMGKQLVNFITAAASRVHPFL